MIVVSEVIGQVGRVLGTCEVEYTYDVLTRAVELLANKPTSTGVLWDPLLVYIDIPVVDGYYVCLPPHIEKAIKINISKQPSFSAVISSTNSRLNGPGTIDPEAGWQWQDRGWKALQKPWPASGNEFMIMSTDTDDQSTPLKVHAINQDGSATWIDAFVGIAGPKIYGILEASKPVTKGDLKVYAAPFILESELKATWAKEILYPAI